MKFIIGLLFLVSSLMAKQVECVLLYYHHKPLPEDILYTYDWIVLDGDNPFYRVLKNKAFYQKRRAKVLGYMSVGEIEKYRDYFQELRKFAIGNNPMWDSFVADVRQKEYRDFLLNVVAKRIAERGFDGFLLDTLDSYQLASKPEEWSQFQSALVKFITELKKRYPDKLILLNRGFEFLERVKDQVDGVVAESLFYGIDTNKRYRKVPEEDRKWLLDQLNRAKAYGLKVIVVDYVDPKDRKKARETVQKIAELGFIPYVADKELSRVGYSKCSIIPRRVLLPYSSKDYPIAQYEPKHRLIAMVLEYLGFVPEMWDVEKGLPEVYPELGYKGIVVGYMAKMDNEFVNWLIKAKEKGLKLFFLNSIPYNEQFLKAFGIKTEKNREKGFGSFKVVSPKNHKPFEVPIKVSPTDTLLIAQSGKPLVEVINSLGQKHHPFALFDWGGYAVNNALLNDEGLWSFDPFEVFKIVFEPSFPIPDLTTQNGGRILTAHIDGDAFFGDAEFDNRKNIGEVIRDEVLKKYPIPHSVSLIVAEVAPEGPYGDRSERLIQVAKSIFSLPWVEPATHTYSHPYDWQPQYRKKDLPYGYNMPVKGYKLDWRTEIEYSAKWIEEKVLDRKKVSLIFWSGECNPNQEQLDIAYSSQLLNINGGYTAITQQEPFLKFVGPSGVNYGPYFQAYAPVQNENIYTNLWSYPFWGYINVIQTFKLTEEPRRLKPISIYYHFYSGQKMASLNALKRVYEFALSQEINPMFVSEYIKWVLDFRHAAIMKEGDGFRIRNEGYLRTLRYPKDWGYPDIKASSGVIGYREGKDGYNYLFLDGSGDYNVLFSQKKPEFNLLYSNGFVESFEKKDREYILRLRSYVPLEVRLESSCLTYINGKPYKRGLIDYKGGNYAEIKAVCID